MDFKKYYSRFLSALAAKNMLHFAAHSHHGWPDISREAHIKYWDDANELVDDKWEHILCHVVPAAQDHISRILKLKDKSQIAFASNTHELLTRLISTFPPTRPIRILTTNSEYHSFRRQIQRMEEDGLVVVVKIDADILRADREVFLVQIIQQLQSEEPFDLFFISQVFFDSGLMISTIEFERLVSYAPAETIVCIDGYHSFAAVDVDLSMLEGRVFFLAGGYKYAQAGEGMCFLVVPHGDWRPAYTGWFAEMSSLAGVKSEAVRYGSDGSSFSGSTKDYSAMYRFVGVWDHFLKEEVTVEAVHTHVTSLQNTFLALLQKEGVAVTSAGVAHPRDSLPFELVNADSSHRGHFLTFDLGDPARCRQVCEGLRERGVWTDHRAQRLRFGFAPYHDEADVTKMVHIVKDFIMSWSE